MKKQDGDARLMNALYLSVAGISVDIGMMTMCAISPAELSGTKEFARLMDARKRLSSVMLQAAKTASAPNCRKVRSACKSFINSVNDVKSMPSAQDQDLRKCLSELRQNAQKIMDKVA